MIPRKWAWVWVCALWACEGGASKERPQEAQEGGHTLAEAIKANALDGVVLREAVGCEGADLSGWCAAIGGEGDQAVLPKPGAPVLGLRAEVRGPRATFTDELWVWVIAGEGERARVGWRQIEGLEPRVRKGLVKQLEEVAKGDREEVVMESPAVAAALRAPAKGFVPVSRDGKGWRVGEAMLWSVGGGRWMSREETRDGVGMWTQWVSVKLVEPASKEDGEGDVPLEKMRARYGCGGEVEGAKAKACEVLDGYAQVTGEWGEGRRSGWFVRPAGEEQGEWMARSEGGAVSLAQEGLKADQEVKAEGGRFEVERAFKGRESEPVVVWTRGPWVIARSRASGTVWLGRLDPIEE